MFTRAAFWRERERESARDGEKKKGPINVKCVNELCAGYLGRRSLTATSHSHFQTHKPRSRLRGPSERLKDAFVLCGTARPPTLSPRRRRHQTCRDSDIIFWFFFVFLFLKATCVVACPCLPVCVDLFLKTFTLCLGRKRDIFAH